MNNSPEEDLEKYERAYEPIWNQYVFFSKKIERQEHRFEFLLLLVSMLIFIFFSLNLHQSHPLNYLALASYVIVFLVSLYSIIPRKFWIPFIQEDRFYNLISKPEEISKQLIDEVYDYASEINALVERRDKYLETMIVLILGGSTVPVAVATAEASPCPVPVALFVALLGAVTVLFFHSKFETFLTKKHMEKEFGTLENICEDGRKKNLSKIAEEEGVNVEVKFTDDNIIPQMPLLPTILNRLKGIFEVPQSFNEKLTELELKAIFYHEIKHAKSHVTIWPIITVLCSVGFGILVARWFGLTFPSSCVYGTLCQIAWLLTFVGAGTLLFMYLYRKHELSADEYGAEKTKPEAMVNALNKYSVWEDETDMEVGKIKETLIKILRPHPKIAERKENIREKFDI